MTTIGKTNYDEFRKRILERPGIRKEYERLTPKYELISLLIQRRKQLQLSQSKVAELIGTRQPAISRLESGKPNTKIDTLYKVVEVLGLDISIKVKDQTDKRGIKASA